MPKHQNLEYKESWRDEYLKWICGFANSQGGKIYIGLDDQGNVKDLADYKKLMDDIPNKIKDILGMLVEVNLHEKEDAHYIEITTPRSEVPISYKSKYYLRSGSTNQELKGAALNEFLLKRTGRTWDDIPVPKSGLKDVDEVAVRTFVKRAQQAKRIAAGVEDESVQEILESLHLISEDSSMKRAALLLFSKDPLRYVTAAYFKIGRFGKTDSELRFQDVIEGNLLQMADKVMEVLQSKYLVSNISYQGLNRIETLEYPEPALREAILNAIVHKDYTGPTIQLSVYDDKLILWNPGKLPEELTIDMLKGKHPSHPRNKNIADAFFKMGYIETWGRGISKIINACQTAGMPEPILEEFAGGFQITFLKDIYTEEYLRKLDLNERQIKAVLHVKEAGRITNKNYQELFSVSRITATRDLANLTEKGILKSSGEKGAGSYYHL